MNLNIILIFLFCLIKVSSTITIETKLGSVSGTIEKSIKGNEFYIFKGIPFAESPVGSLRFKKPGI